MPDMRPPHALSAGRAARLGATRGFHHGLLGNAAFWRTKLRRNQALDHRVTEQLEGDGWTVLRVWECDVNKQLDVVALRIQRMVKECAALRTEGDPCPVS